MQIFRNIFINLYSLLFQKCIIKKELDRLATLHTPPAAQLIKALRKNIDKSYSKEEKALFQKIELIRKSRLRDSRKINVENLGAATGTSGLKKQFSLRKLVISSKSPFWARVLFSIIREYRPAHCLELGCNMGISTAYQAAALQLNDNGRIATIEGSQERLKIAQAHFQELNLKNIETICGDFNEKLPGACYTMSPLDYAFIDGNHDKDATIKYFQTLLPHLSEQAIIIFDDIHWSKGMIQAWDTIKQHPRVNFSSDLFVLGICCL